MSFLARVSYNADGSTDTFSFSFPYILSSHVKAYVDGVEDTSITFPTSSSVQLSSTPANGAVVLIQRITPSDSRLVDFQDGSVLTSADLDQSADQNFYLSQETKDNVASKLGLDSSDRYDATNKRIINVANPTADQDAVTKYYLENTWLSTANKTALTTVNNNISNINAVNSNSSNINTVAGSDTNINTVATNISSVNTVATNINDVIAVANDLAEAVSEVETVANDLNEATSEIDTVATNIANVNTVGNNISNVNTVAGVSANITTVAGISSNVTTVAGISTNVTTVAGISSDVTTVAGDSSDIQTVAGDTTNIGTLAGISSDITTVAGVSSNVTTVAGISSNITTVAGISSDVSTVATNNSNVTSVAGAITNINTVASDIANVNSVATNITGVNSFAERYRVSSTQPSTSLDNGDLWFDVSAGKLKIWDGSSFALAGSSVNGTSDRFIYTATAGQTTFSGADDNGDTLTYDVAGGTVFADIYLNGVKLAPADFTATNGTSIVLASGATVNDILQVVSYGTFTLSSQSASNITSGTLDNARLSSIPNSALANSSITLNGSAVSLGGSATIGTVWESKSASFSAEAGKAYFVNSSSGAVTATLPTSATIGDEIRFLDVASTFDTNNLVVARNGHKIQGATSDLTVATERAGFALVYYDTNEGWLLKDK